MNILTTVKRQIPNLITLGNLLCGVLACIYTYEETLHLAALFICLGIFLDFFDGLTARLLGVSSPMGKELDSLADVVTSGVAPGMMLYVILIQLSSLTWLCYLALLIPLFAAYRLAKFNLDTRQSHSFLGLPVPSNALIWVGIALYFSLPQYNHSPQFGTEYPILAFLLVAVSLVTDILMVSELPMFSLKFNFKDLSWKTNSVQYIFLIGCAIIIGLTRQWYAISLIILWYIIFSIISQRKHPAHD